MATNALIQSKTRNGATKLQELESKIRQACESRLEGQPLFDHHHVATTVKEDPLKARFSLDEIGTWDEHVSELHHLNEDGVIEICDVFSGGNIPICYWLDNTHTSYHVDPSLTYSLWCDLEIHTIYDRASWLSNAHPAVFRFCLNLCEHINEAMSAGQWSPAEMNDAGGRAGHHEVTNDEGDHTFIFIQHIDIWRVTDVEHDTSIVHPEGGETIVDLTVSPIMGATSVMFTHTDQQIMLKGLRESSVFLQDELGLDRHSQYMPLTPHLCRYDLPMTSTKVQTAYGDDTPTAGDVVIHFPAGGEYSRYRHIDVADGETPHVFNRQAHYQWTPDPLNGLDFMLRWPGYEKKGRRAMWRTSMTDFVTGKYDPAFKPENRSENKYRDYGKWTEERGDVGFDEGERFMYPCQLNSAEDLLSRLWENISAGVEVVREDADDDEWGRSSRFVHAWKDKRKVKIIDKTNGETPHWSDIIRCEICNGQVKVLLKKITTTLIFDCPHCGETESVDGSHLSEGAAWPANKKRKVVDAK